MTTLVVQFVLYILSYIFLSIANFFPKSYFKFILSIVEVLEVKNKEQECSPGILGELPGWHLNK